MPVDIYLATVSPHCRAVVMTAKCIGLELNYKPVDIFDAKEQYKPEFLKMNPQHTVPVMDDNGFILTESSAIQTYFVNKYAADSPLYPSDPQERAKVDGRLYFDVGTLYKAIFEYLYPLVLSNQPINSDKKEAYETAMTYLEGYLDDSPYVAGDHMTVADISVIASLSFAELAEFTFEDYPKISAWMCKIKAEIPSYSEINDGPMQEYMEMMKRKANK